MLVQRSSAAAGRLSRSNEHRAGRTAHAESTAHAELIDQVPARAQRRRVSSERVGDYLREQTRV
jgi:hypothetical protein